MKMKRQNLLSTLGLALALCVGVKGLSETAIAAPLQEMAMARISGKEVMVGGMMMSPLKNIVQNAMNSKDHTTLVTAVKAAGLVEALMGKGPFTVFAPTNAAFGKLPDGTVETLVMPENKETLAAVLTYHVVAGNYDMKALRGLIKKGNGVGMLKTLQGGTLQIMMNGPMNIVVSDAGKNIACISTYDVRQSNGVIHVVDSVLMPK